MAKCEVCAKELTFGNNVSHSNRNTTIIKPYVSTL